MLYTLKCGRCSHKFDVNMSYSEYLKFLNDKGILLTCPNCKKKSHPYRVIRPIPVIYKSPGFYSTDKDRNVNSS